MTIGGLTVPCSARSMDLLLLPRYSCGSCRRVPGVSYLMPHQTLERRLYVVMQGLRIKAAKIRLCGACNGLDTVQMPEKMSAAVLRNCLASADCHVQVKALALINVTLEEIVSLLAWSMHILLIRWQKRETEGVTYAECFRKSSKAAVVQCWRPADDNVQIFEGR